MIFCYSILGILGSLIIIAVSLKKENINKVSSVYIGVLALGDLLQNISLWWRLIMVEYLKTGE